MERLIIEVKHSNLSDKKSIFSRFFVTEFCKDVVPYLKEELKEVKAELKKAFEATDLNKDGWISEEEMWSAINSGRFTNWSNSDVQDALDKADKDELGRFNYERR